MKKTVLILLTPVGVLLGIFWFSAIFWVVHFITSYGLNLSYELWIRLVMVFMSTCIIFPILAGMFARRIKDAIKGD